jgi:glycosyltransferase involved in cell wall biosynthesis
MKILFLTASLNTPSARFRILQHLETWRGLGFEIKALPLPKNNWARFKLSLQLPDLDVVVLQKRLLHRHTFYLLRQRAKILLYDFDDAVMFSDSNAGGNFVSERRVSRFTAVTGSADLLLAGNDYLKEEALKAGARRVEVVPTGVDCDYFRPRSQADEQPDGSLLTLGWIGSKQNLVYLKALARPLNRLYEKRKDFKLNIVCNDFIDDFHCPVEKIEWSAANEVTDIQDFDVGLMPLADDPWTKGKCAFKLLQYMACGRPGVASRTAVTQKIIEQHENGFLAATPEEMVDKIAWLLDHRQLLPDIGRRARASILGVYDSHSVALRYAEIFKQVAGR